jgi:hypothetical protein
MLAILLTSTLVSQFAKKFPGYTSSNLAEKGVHGKQHALPPSIAYPDIW